MQTMTVVTIPEPIRRAYALTARGEAVVEMIRLTRRWSTMPAPERSAAIGVVREQLDLMDAEDRSWVEPMLTDLAG